MPMELDALKTIWLNTEVSLPGQVELSREFIGKTIAKKSNTVISQIRRRLKLKVVVQLSMGILGLVLAAFLIRSKEMFTGILYLGMFSTILMLGIHKLKEYRMLVRFQKSSDSLRATLVRIIEIMDKVIRAQIYTTVSMATVFMALFSFMALEKYGGVPGEIKVLVTGVAVLVSPFAFYFIAKRGQKKMFGNYVQKLKEYLNELDAETE